MGNPISFGTQGVLARTGEKPPISGYPVRTRVRISHASSKGLLRSAQQIWQYHDSYVPLALK